MYLSVISWVVFCFLFCLLCRVGFCAQLFLRLCAEQCFLVLVDAAGCWLFVQVAQADQQKQLIYTVMSEDQISLCVGVAVSTAPQDCN